MPGIERLRRRRARRRVLQSLLAATAVIAVVLAATGLVRQAVSAPMPAATPSPSPTQVLSAEEVWPQAVVKIPARTTDGLDYRPVAAVDARRVLLLVERDRYDGAVPLRFELHDASTGQISLVTELQKGTKVGTVRANDRHLVWDAGGGIINAKPDLWTVPVSGGVPSRVLREDVGHFEVVEDDLVWDTGKGVFLKPLAGGTAQAVPGGEGKVLPDWPWAVPYTGPDPASGVEAVNLETGDKRLLDWGGREVAWRQPSIARSHDGSRTVRLPGAVTEPPALNRFAMLPIRDQIVDLTTGTTAVFAPQGASPGGIGFLQMRGRTLVTKTVGDEVWVLNLRAIP